MTSELKKAIQGDMFSLDDLSESEQKSLLKNMPEEVIKNRNYWPHELAEIADFIHFELNKIDEIDADKQRLLMECILVGLSFYCGGRHVYLPKGEKLKNAIRDTNIWQGFDGQNVRDLSRQYHLSEQKIYQIIRDQRQLHSSRIQRSFNF